MDIREISHLLNNASLVAQKLKDSNKVFVRGTGLGETAVQLVNIDAPQICLCADSDSCVQMADALTHLGRKALAVDIPNDAFTTFKYASRKNLFSLISSIAEFVSGKVDILCITPQLLYYPLPRKEEFSSRGITLRVGASFAMEELSAKLVANGYARVEQVEDMGEFVIRGDILDIYPVGQDNPIRVSFWGDEVESIYAVEMATLSKLSSLEDIHILPASLVYLDQDERNSALKTIASLMAMHQQEINQYVNLARELELGSLSLDSHILSQLFPDKYTNILEYNASAIKVTYREFTILETLKKLRLDYNKKCQTLLHTDFIYSQANADKEVVFDQIDRQKEQVYLSCEVLGNYLTRFDDLLVKTKEYISWGRKVVFCIKTS